MHLSIEKKFKISFVDVNNLQSSDGRKENTMTINHDKDLEFVVQGLSLEKIYVFSVLIIL